MVSLDASAIHVPWPCLPADEQPVGVGDGRAVAEELAGTDGAVSHGWPITPAGGIHRHACGSPPTSREASTFAQSNAPMSSTATMGTNGAS